jgi:hypothetical protein
MNRKWDIEDLLMHFRIEPGTRVKRAVLSKYMERYRSARVDTGAREMWRRPVPLYVAAALVIIAAGLSFIGGQKLSRSDRIPESSSIAAQDSLIGEALRQSLRPAPRDVF